MESNNNSDFNSGTNHTTFRDYVRVLFRQKGVVLTVIVTVMAVVYLGLEFKTPIYKAQVKMLVSAEKQVESPFFRQLVNYQRIEVTQTQSVIVTSDPVIVRVVKSLKLDQRPFDYEKTYSSPLKHSLIDRQVEFLKTKLAKLSQKQQDILRTRMAINDLKASIQVEPVRDTNLFTISVQDFDPDGAAAIANAIGRSYVIYDMEQQLAELTQKYGDKHSIISHLKDNIRSMQANLTGGAISGIAAMGPGSVKIIEQASVPFQSQGQSKHLTLILAFVMSVFVGVMMAFVFEYLDPTFKMPYEIENALKLPVLGSLSRKRLMEKVLIDGKTRKTLYGRYYQNLSDQVYLLLKNRKLNSLMFTAADSREGPSIIVANLGLYLSQKAGQKVLLIDANLRNSSLQRMFRHKGPGGLADILEGKASLKERIVEINQNLHVLFAGKAELNPVLLLDSNRFKEILEDAKGKYAITMIDCSSLKNYKDAETISPYVDAICLVVSEGITRREVFKKAVLPLQEEKKANILGVIFNQRTFPIPKFVYERV